MQLLFSPCKFTSWSYYHSCFLLGISCTFSFNFTNWSRIKQSNFIVFGKFIFNYLNKSIFNHILELSTICCFRRFSRSFNNSFFRRVGVRVWDLKPLLQREISFATSRLVIWKPISVRVLNKGSWGRFLGNILFCFSSLLVFFGLFLSDFWGSLLFQLAHHFEMGCSNLYFAN